MYLIIVCIVLSSILSFKLGGWIERQNWKYGVYFLDKTGIAKKVIPFNRRRQQNGKIINIESLE